MGFFTDVLGTAGKVALVLDPRDGGGLTHKWVDLAAPGQLAKAVTQVDEVNQAGADVYFTPGTFAGKIVRGYVEKTAVGQLGKMRGRKQVNAQGARAFWVDLDAGPEKAAKHPGKVYVDRRAALAALEASLAAAGTLPDPTYVVNSGVGLHAYWCLTEEMVKEDWVRVAVRFRDTLVATGLLLDASRSKDIASILRIPGSIHWGETTRTGSEVRGALMGDGRLGDVVSPEAFIEGLLASRVQPERKAPRPAQASAQRPPAPKGTVSIGKFQVPAQALTRSAERASAFGVLQPPEENAYNIKLVRRTLETMGSDLGYEEWRNVIWAVKATGWDCAYEILEDWCGTSTVEWGKPWQDELRRVWDSDASPTGGVGVGSIIAWARKQRADDKLRFLSGEDAVQASQEKQRVVVRQTRTKRDVEFEVPKIEFPFRRRSDRPGLECRVPTGEDSAGEVEYEWERFVNTDVFVVDRIYNRDNSVSVALVKIEPHDGMTPFTINAAHLASPAKTAEALANMGISCNGKRGWNHMSAYLDKQVQDLIQERRAVRKMPSLGWHRTEEGMRFAHGEFIYREGGGQELVQYTDNVQALAENSRPTGSLEQWKQIIDLYSTEDYAPAQAVFLLSMGAPLTRLTGEIGGMVNFFTVGSGYGKSTIMKAALSVWGAVQDPPNPNTAFVGRTTMNSAETLLSHANSLPVCLDELTKAIENSGRKLKDDLREFIYSATQGRGKARMKGSSDEIRDVGTWDVFLFSTSNAPLESLFAGNTSNSNDAERARTLDIDGYGMPYVENFRKSGIDEAELLRRRHILSTVMAENYGVAGQMLIEAYMEDYDGTVAAVQDAFVRYQMRYGMRDRFVVAKVAIARVAWAYATALGIIDFPWQPVEAVFTQALSAQHEARSENISDDPEAMLNEYLRQNAGHLAVVKHIGGKPVPLLSNNSGRAPLIGRWEVDRNRLYLMRGSAEGLKAFCAENRVLMKDIDDFLYERKALLSAGTKVTLGRGLGIPGQSYVMEIDPIKAGITLTEPVQEEDEDED